MVNLKQIQQDVSNLPEEAQMLVTDFIESLKKRYSVGEKQEIDIPPKNQSSTLDILKELTILEMAKKLKVPRIKGYD